MALDADRAEKPVRKLRKLLKKMPATPGADDIHDFRTNSRRTEATPEALSLDSGNNCRRILKELSRLRKRPGKVRDMDVLTDYLLGVSHLEKEKAASKPSCSANQSDRDAVQQAKSSRTEQNSKTRCK